jgi:hypothetical protein
MCEFEDDGASFSRIKHSEFYYLTIGGKKFITSYQPNNTKATISQGAVKTAIVAPTTNACFLSKCK